MWLNADLLLPYCFWLQRKRYKVCPQPKTTKQVHSLEPTGKFTLWVSFCSFTSQIPDRLWRQASKPACNLVQFNNQELDYFSFIRPYPSLPPPQLSNNPVPVLKANVISQCQCPNSLDQGPFLFHTGFAYEVLWWAFCFWASPKPSRLSLPGNINITGTSLGAIGMCTDKCTTPQET